MRITNQMMARTAAKTGIPLQQNTLLDIMNKKSAFTGNAVSSLGNAGSAVGSANSFLQKLNSKSSAQLKEAAESLEDYVSKLCDDGKNSLFARAEATGDKSELIANITGMADAYNKTLKYLGGSDSALNKFYAQELKNYTSDHSDALKAAGVTRNKDGSLSVQKDALNAADLDSLKEAFGSASGFSDKVGYVAGRTAENASAASASILGGYDRNGMDYWNSFTKNMYNFWG